MYVITRTERPKLGKQHSTMELNGISTAIKSENVKYLLHGGAEVINELLKHYLIDDL